VSTDEHDTKKDRWWRGGRYGGGGGGGYRGRADIVEVIVEAIAEVMSR